MNIAVVGGGPLGLVYATHLCKVGMAVTLVRRHPQSTVESWRVISRLTKRAFDVQLVVSDAVPLDVDVVLIAVRAEQLNETLVERVLSARPKAVVCMTPVLGKQLDTWRDKHPELVLAMPAFAAECEGGRLFYWVAPSTLVERRDANPALLALVDGLRRAGIPVRWLRDAAQRSCANTVTLFPVQVAICLEPRLHLWLRQPRFLSELALAMTAARRLALRLGAVEVGLRLASVCMSSALGIRLVVHALLLATPHLALFLERHFGPKLRAQHLLLERDIAGLANQHSVGSPIPAAWRERLVSG